jgi:hypothetical protein
LLKSLQQGKSIYADLYGIDFPSLARVGESVILYAMGIALKPLGPGYGS